MNREVGRFVRYRSNLSSDCFQSESEKFTDSVAKFISLWTFRLAELSSSTSLKVCEFLAMDGTIANPESSSQTVTAMPRSLLHECFVSGVGASRFYPATPNQLVVIVPDEKLFRLKVDSSLGTVKLRTVFDSARRLYRVFFEVAEPNIPDIRIRLQFPDLGAQFSVVVENEESVKCSESKQIEKQ